jgi:glycosyltransferase involved in cell wall biosynthesis
MADEKKIWVVIPAYQAERTVADVLRGIPSWIAGIIVVDDASTDGTAQAVERFGDPRVVLVRRSRNGGVGAAVCDGYRKALELGAAIVVKMDADGQMDSAQLPRLLHPILVGRADVTKGNRFRHFGALKQMPQVRLFGNSMLSFLIKIASGYWDIMDPTNGYVAIHRNALRALPLEKLHPRFFFESSQLIRLNIAGAVVVDVPIEARYEGERSHLNIASAAGWFPLLILRGLIVRVFWRYFIQDFTATSLFLVMAALLGGFGVIFGAIHWARSALTGIATTSGQVMIAALPLLVAIFFLTQALVLDIQAIPHTPLSTNEEPPEGPWKKP